LSLGCGGNPDLRWVAQRVRPYAPEFVLLDGDLAALEFSQSILPDLSDQCTYVCGNVVRELRGVLKGGGFDLVVAGGLFDYLPDRVIEHLLKMLMARGLNPGGRVFFTNFSNENPFTPG
jgi:O-methyltransferase involved in polyketide biosynthesis